MAPSSLLTKFCTKFVWSYCWHNSIEHRGLAEARADTGKIHLFTFPSERPVPVSLQVKGSIATYSRATREEAGAEMGQMITTLASENILYPALQLTPLAPPRPLLWGRVLQDHCHWGKQKNSTEQDAWKVKDESTVFVLLSYWRQEHRTIKHHVICQQNV